jgi:hypothetical protein
LVWANQSIVAVDACRNTRPDAFAIITVLDKTLASGESILHSLAFASIKNGWVATLTAGHWLVVFVLGQAIGKTVSDKDRLQIDVSLLVGKNLGCENWDIVTGIRFSGDVEVLLRIFGELLKEESKESIYILASSNCVAN